MTTVDRPLLCNGCLETGRWPARKRDDYAHRRPEFVFIWYLPDILEGFSDQGRAPAWQRVPLAPLGLGSGGYTRQVASENPFFFHVQQIRRYHNEHVTS